MISLNKQIDVSSNWTAKDLKLYCPYLYTVRVNIVSFPAVYIIAQ